MCELEKERKIGITEELKRQTKNEKERNKERGKMREEVGERHQQRLGQKTRERKRQGKTRINKECQKFRKRNRKKERERERKKRESNAMSEEWAWTKGEHCLPNCSLSGKNKTHRSQAHKNMFYLEPRVSLLVSKGQGRLEKEKKLSWDISTNVLL